MRIILIMFFILIPFMQSFSQDEILKKGNDKLNKGDFSGAEKIFREAIKNDSTNLIYRNQLALTLVEQKKHNDAQLILDKILLKDSSNLGALWYSGLNNFLDNEGDLRRGIYYFEKVLLLINEDEKQYFAGNWFIGRSYHLLLQSKGVSAKELQRMLECYTTYLELQPDAEDVETISTFVRRIKSMGTFDNVETIIIK